MRERTAPTCSRSRRRRSPTRASRSRSTISRDIRERLRGSFATLLRRAQEAGAVRPELEVEDVTAFVVAVLAVAGRAPGSAVRIMAVVRDGLRPPRPAPNRRRARRPR